MQTPAHSPAKGSPWQAKTLPLPPPPPHPAEGRQGGPEGGPGDPRGGGAMLDPPTRGSELSRALGQRIGDRRARVVWSRVHLGLALGGRLYWLTLTSSPSSPPIRRTWKALRLWLRRHHKGAHHIHVITDEGHGVIHIVIRIRRDRPRIDVRELRTYWQKTHGATQIRIERVRSITALSRYLAEQGRRALSGEMAHQVLITSWGYTRGWIPVHFADAFGRYWARQRQAGVSPDDLSPLIDLWVRQVAEDPSRIEDPPCPTITSSSVPSASSVGASPTATEASPASTIRTPSR